MIVLNDAKRIVGRHIAKFQSEGMPELMIIDEATIEEPFGWVFFYNTRSFIEFGSLSDSLVGNAPIIVCRQDGSLHETGTAHPVEHYIAEFRKKWS